MNRPKFFNYMGSSSQNYGLNSLCFLDSEGNKFYYSYETLIAFAVRIIKNYWNTTTGKHLNQIDPDHDIRLDNEEFEKEYNNFFGNNENFDQISINWFIEDIKEQARKDHILLNDQDCRKILYNLKKYHDSEIGINWLTITITTENYIKENKNDFFNKICLSCNYEITIKNIKDDQICPECKNKIKRDL